MYSYRVEQAIRAASVLHKDQVRRGSMPFPFVTHVIATAFTLLDYTDDEDVIVAALLHDTLEMTDYSLEELREDFGGHVSDLVETLTEPSLTTNPGVSWRDAKMAYVKQLKKGHHDALLIAAADKIHNFRTIVEDYSDAPARFIKDFGKNSDERLEMYELISTVINSRLSHPILAEFNHVFASYKEFLQAVKDYQERF
jgi:(p)ppGpp synthase/HD superfamily hydrolase